MVIEELKEKARTSRRHFLMLLDLLESGEPGAREALEDIAPPDDETAESDADGERQAFWAELVEVKELLNANPASVAALDDLRRRGRSLGPCEEVQAMGLESYRLRRLGHLSAARDLLDHAEVTGADCRACLLEIGRRQAVLLAAQGDHGAAMERIETCLAGYRKLGPGHNLDGDGVARCLSMRGQIRLFLGDADGAIADLGASLERWRPESPPFLIGLLNLGVALERSGHREEAYQLLRKPRLRFRSLPPSAHRAVFDLLDGQLEYQRGTRNRHRGRQKIRDAVNGFAALGMPDELTRAIADYVRSLRRNPEAVFEFLKEIHGKAEAIVTAPEQIRRLRQIFELSRDLSGPLPTRSVRRRMAQAMEHAIDELRAGILPGVPCLIS